MLTLDTLRLFLGASARKVPLADAVVEQIERDGFKRLKVEYNVEFGERISAYVFIPDGALNSPAVLCHHQHASNFELGKSEVAGIAGDPDQAIGPELARLGYVVIAPDAIGFEERNWSFPTGQAQYFELASRLIKGETLLAKVLHDVSVAIDFLASMESVDPERIGFIGHSYGGRMAIWGAAFDHRIKAAVSNCGCVNYKDSLDRDIGIQMEFCVPNILDTCDIEDVTRLIAPRALYLSAATEDKYSRGAEVICEYARSAFPDTQLKCKMWEGGHEFTNEMREAAYQFLSDKL